MKFSDLDLHPEILGAIEKLGYQECTPIQASVIPTALEGKDVAGLAQTGTGKTAAFVTPLLDRLMRSKNLTADQVVEEKYQKRIFPEWKAQEFILVLVPTRELVDQVVGEIDKLKGNFPIKVLAVYGGTGYDKQIAGFKGGVDFVVGTPGRLIDLYKTHSVDFRQVRAIVFDEADRMFDMGFRDDMKYILRRVPQTRQFLVFSATLNFEVLNTAYQYGADPVECNVSRDQAKAENVKDEIYQCGHVEKPQFLLSTLKKSNAKQVIIFSNFKHNVERIAQFLNENEYPAVAISSLLTQAQRNRVIDQFKAENHLNILVATDLAARGLDIKGVDLVINFEMPDDPENYVHRIGRTGRAGAEGRAVSLVCDRDVEALQRIEEYLKHKILVGWMEDSELVKEYKEFPRGDGASRMPSRGASGPSPRGGNDRGPRRGNDGPRRPNRDQSRRDQPRREAAPRGDQAAPGASPESREARPNGQHRDRASGRHNRHTQGATGSAQNRPNENRPQHPRNARGEGRPDNRGPRRDTRHRNSDERAKSFAQPKRVAKPTVGQKITGFFKGLFGSSSKKA